MQRSIAGTGWLIDLVGLNPVEPDLGRGLYRALEYPREVESARPAPCVGTEAEALRLAR